MGARPGSTAPLERARLTEVFTRGHRPRADWRLGLEYEQFVTDRAGHPVPYSGPGGVESLLRRLAQLTSWRPTTEDGHVLGLVAPDGRALTLEPGAQLEFNTSPCRTLAEIDEQVQGYFQLLRQLRDETGACFLALGSHPTAAPEQIERIPKARYDILEPYLQQAGELGIWMMKTTCSIQVSIDHEDAADAARKLRTAFALSPIMNALFARSPLRAGELSGFASWRGHIWTKTDPARCGIVEACTRAGSTLEDFAEWALQAPMLFIEREARMLDMRGQTFAEFLEQGAGTLRATVGDWELHLSTVFPEVRLRPHIEIRSQDTHCPAWSLALCALVKGIYYDEAALEAAWQLTAHWSHAERLAALDQAHRHGLQGAGPDGSLLDYARKLVGLCALDSVEASYLEPMRCALDDGLSQGERIAARFRDEWKGDMAALVRAVRCIPEEEAAA